MVLDYQNAPLGASYASLIPSSFNVKDYLSGKLPRTEQNIQYYNFYVSSRGANNTVNSTSTGGGGGTFDVAEERALTEPIPIVSTPPTNPDRTTSNITPVVSTPNPPDTTQQRATTPVLTPNTSKGIGTIGLVVVAALGLYVFTSKKRRNK